MNLAHIYPQGTNALILAHGYLGTTNGKTAHGILQYGEVFSIQSVVDKSKAGITVGTVIPRLDRAAHLPVHASVKEALAEKEAKVLLLGVALPGGVLPESWRQEIKDALESGLDVIAGLHLFLSEDPEFKVLAEKAGTRLIDLRKPPEKLQVATRKVRETSAKVVLCLGTDCVVGKRTATSVLYQTAKEIGKDAAFLATGQTGLMLGCDEGAVIDRIPADFVAGQVEKMVLDLHGREKEIIFVEGQGALLHPSYSGVTLSLLHGSDPQAVVLVHDPQRPIRDGFEDLKLEIPGWEAERELIEKLSRAKVAALATWGTEKKELLAKEADIPVFDLTDQGEAGKLIALLDQFFQGV